MATGKNKAAMLRLGYFSEPGYNTIGDKFERERTSADDRYLGRQMQTTVGRKGKTGRGCYFSKPPRLFDGDYYTTWEEIQRRYRNEKSKGAIGTAPFRPANPAKKQSGTGDYYGTVGAKWKNLDTGLEHKLKREDVKSKPPNIVTAPSKRGSYGTWGTFLGYRKGFKGTAGEYQYLPDPYDANRMKQIEEIKKARGVEPDRPPFRPANPPKKGGPGYSTRTLSKQEYRPEGPAPKTVRKKADPDEPVDERPPFRPSHVSASGTRSSFPKYIEDPYENKEKQRVADWKKQQEMMKKVGDRPAFVAMSWEKSERTPSVFRMNIKLPPR